MEDFEHETKKTLRFFSQAAGGWYQSFPVGDEQRGLRRGRRGSLGNLGRRGLDETEGAREALGHVHLPGERGTRREPGETLTSKTQAEPMKSGPKS